MTVDAAADFGEGRGSRGLSVLRHGEAESAAADLRTALQPDAVAVSDGVLLRLNAKVGDTIRIGGQPFRIIAEVTNEPDRMTGSLNVGPRVMMSRAGLERTGLLIPGSRAAERFLFKVPPAMQIADVRAELKKAFREGADRRLQRGASADRAGPAAIDHVPVAGQPDRAGDRRAGRGDRDSGAPAAEDGFHRDHEVPGREVGQVLRIYVLQTAGLGLAGSLVGHRAGQPGADGVSAFSVALLSTSRRAALRRRVRAAGAAAWAC